jgi:hypothetical protein
VLFPDVGRPTPLVPMPLKVQDSAVMLATPIPVNGYVSFILPRAVAVPQRGVPHDHGCVEDDVSTDSGDVVIVGLPTMTLSVAGLPSVPGVT